MNELYSAITGYDQNIRRLRGGAQWEVIGNTRWMGLRPSILWWRFMTGFFAFLYAAIAAVERGDADGRRAAVKRALDIIIHLQARLRMDVGGQPAKSLSEFYAADLRANFAGVAVGLQGQVRARHRLRTKRARCLAAGGQRVRYECSLYAGDRHACAPRG